MLWYLLAICVVVAGAILGPLFLGWLGAVAALAVCGPIAVWAINRGMYERG